MTLLQGLHIRYPAYQISCISDIYIAIHNSSNHNCEVATTVILWLGVTTSGVTLLKGHSIRKVETHWRPRRKAAWASECSFRGRAFQQDRGSPKHWLPSSISSLTARVQGLLGHPQLLRGDFQYLSYSCAKFRYISTDKSLRSHGPDSRPLERKPAWRAG